MNIAFLGLGLIGGSVARALRERRSVGTDDPIRIAAWTPSGVGPRAAHSDGVVDVAASSPEAAIDGADLVVLAGPVPACVAMLDELAGPWRTSLGPDSVITDVASSKSALVLRATALGLRFVGGHPMSGRDASGYAASSGDLFVDRPWVVVPGADEAATTRVEALARVVGAWPVRMSAQAHDDAVAGISHLPLLVSVALVETVAGAPGAERPGWSDAGTLAAGGWRDTTRLARGDVSMGAGIMVTNGAPVAARVRDLIATLTAWAEELERPGGPDPDVVARRLAAARATLEARDR